ncbi:MAG: Hpt domain-containing protein, partial [Thiohalocapsa sp.]
YGDFSVDELSMRAEDAVSGYSDRFDEWLENDLRKLNEAWTDASRGDATENIWHDVSTAAHDLHGAAGSYGYPSISRLCGSLCRLLDAAGDSADPALIELHINACKAAHAANAKSLDDDVATSEVCEALENSVRQHEIAVAG